MLYSLWNIPNHDDDDVVIVVVVPVVDGQYRDPDDIVDDASS